MLQNTYEIRHGQHAYTLHHKQNNAISGPEVLFKTCVAMKFVDDDDDDDDDE